MSEAGEPFRRVVFDTARGRVAGIALGPQTPHPDIVFLHATGFNARSYRALLQPLGDRFHVLALDARGHGRSELEARLFGYTSWRVHRDDVIAVLEQFPIPVTLAGHSLGATVSLLVAGRRPDLVGGAALIEPVILGAAGYAAMEFPFGPLLGRVLYPIARAAARRRARFADVAEARQAYLGRGVFAAFAEEMLDDYLADGLREDPGGGVRLACRPAYEAATFAAQRHDPWMALRQVTRPLIVLRAQRDSTLSLASFHRFASIKPDVRLAIVEGAGHMLPMERPDRVRAALESAALMARSRGGTWIEPA